MLFVPDELPEVPHWLHSLRISTSGAKAACTPVWQRPLDHTSKSFLYALLGALNPSARSQWALWHPGSGPPLGFSTLSDGLCHARAPSVTREWHCRHHLPKEQWSTLVTPRYSQAGNRTSSHHSHTSTHYTVKQKYLYFPRWLQSFLMPLTLNHVLCSYLRKTPNTCWAGTTAWYGLASATPRAAMGSLVCLWCLGKACHAHCRPRLCSTALSLMNIKLSPSPLAESCCVSDLKRAETTPVS